MKGVMMLRHAMPHPRFFAFLAVFIAACVVGFQLGLSWPVAFVGAFDAAAVLFIAAAAPLWEGPHDLERMRASAARDDGGRAFLLLLMIVIVGAVLVSVVVLLQARARFGVVLEAFVVVSEVVAWVFANLIYAFHYARIYYDHDPDTGDRGGLSLPGGRQPVFADFVNFAFVIGMTCQTADIGITSERLRRAATMHGIAAFFFNIGVFAITVNIVAGAASLGTR